MSSFEEDYERQIEEARARATARGRGDVLDYLQLKAANDSLRGHAVVWLLESFTALAGELNRAGAGLALARTGAHRFRVGNSTMTGERLVLKRGLRALTIEAGWPRSPRDGIVRGGGLACAHVAHFGYRKGDEELLLVPSETETPRWLFIEKTGARTELQEERLRRHVVRLLD